jgi:hypothetical protein
LASPIRNSWSVSYSAISYLQSVQDYEASYPLLSLLLRLGSYCRSFGIVAKVLFGVVSTLDSVDRWVVDEQEIRSSFGGHIGNFLCGQLKFMG